MERRDIKILLAGAVIAFLGLGIAFYAYHQAQHPYIYLPAGITKGYGQAQRGIEVQFAIGKTYKELLGVNGDTYTIVNSSSSYFAIYPQPISTIYYIFTGMPVVTGEANLEDIIGNYSVYSSDRSVVLEYGGAKYTYSPGETVSVFTVSGLTITALPKTFVRVENTSVMGERKIPPSFGKTNLYSVTAVCGACIKGTFTVPSVVYVYRGTANGGMFGNSKYYNAIDSTMREVGWVKTSGVDFTYTKFASGTEYTEVYTLVQNGKTTTSTIVSTTSITPMTMYPVFSALPVVTINGTTMFYDGVNDMGIIVSRNAVTYYRVVENMSSIDLYPVATEYLVSANYTTVIKEK